MAEECDAAPAFKQAYLRSRKEDVQLIESPVGLAARAIRNSFLEKVEKQGRIPVQKVPSVHEPLQAGGNEILHLAGID